MIGRVATDILKICRVSIVLNYMFAVFGFRPWIWFTYTPVCAWTCPPANPVLCSKAVPNMLVKIGLSNKSRGNDYGIQSNAIHWIVRSRSSLYHCCDCRCYILVKAPNCIRSRMRLLGLRADIYYETNFFRTKQIKFHKRCKKVFYFKHIRMRAITKYV